MSETDRSRFPEFELVAEPFEPRSAPCPLCFTPMTVTAGGVQGLTDHLERCTTATDEERVFYRDHRRWPPTAAQRAAANTLRRESRREAKQMTDEQKAEYAAKTKAAVEGARRDEARRAKVAVPPLLCPGGCGRDISPRGQDHPRGTDCVWGRRWWKHKDELAKAAKEHP